MGWRLKRTSQCAKCPWRKDVDPREIPDGYSEEKHRKLASTIAQEGDITGMLSGRLAIMACHESHDAHCLGWLMNQLGPGNNIALRMHVRSCDNLRSVRLAGEQHERFQDTLPGDTVECDNCGKQIAEEDIVSHPMAPVICCRSCMEDGDPRR